VQLRANFVDKLANSFDTAQQLFLQLAELLDFALDCLNFSGRDLLLLLHERLNERIVLRDQVLNDIAHFRLQINRLLSTLFKFVLETEYK